MDKRKLSQEPPPPLSGPDGRSANTSGTVSLEALHQLAASYFTDRESTLRRLHHLQIASSAIRVRARPGRALLLPLWACQQPRKAASWIKHQGSGSNSLNIYGKKSLPRFIFLCFPLKNIKTGSYQETPAEFVSFQDQ